MDNKLKVLGTMYLESGKEILAMIQYDDLPIYGTQFHLEKV